MADAVAMVEDDDMMDADGAINYADAVDDVEDEPEVRCLGSTRGAQLPSGHDPRVGMCPIIGIRYHLLGEDCDLCQEEYDKLTEAEKADYEAIAPPVFDGASPTDNFPSPRKRGWPKASPRSKNSAAKSTSPRRPVASDKSTGDPKARKEALELRRLQAHDGFNFEADKEDGDTLAVVEGPTAGGVGAAGAGDKFDEKLKSAHLRLVRRPSIESTRLACRYAGCAYAKGV